MNFIVDLLNNIYNLVKGILYAAGIDTTTWPGNIIGDKDAE